MRWLVPIALARSRRLRAPRPWATTWSRTWRRSRSLGVAGSAPDPDPGPAPDPAPDSDLASACVATSADCTMWYTYQMVQTFRHSLPPPPHPPRPGGTRHGPGHVLDLGLVAGATGRRVRPGAGRLELALVVADRVLRPRKGGARSRRGRGRRRYPPVQDRHEGLDGGDHRPRARSTPGVPPADRRADQGPSGIGRARAGQGRDHDCVERIVPDLGARPRHVPQVVRWPVRQRARGEGRRAGAGSHAGVID